MSNYEKEIKLISENISALISPDKDNNRIDYIKIYDFIANKDAKIGFKEIAEKYSGSSFCGRKIEKNDYMVYCENCGGEKSVMCTEYFDLKLHEVFINIFKGT